MTYIIVEPCVGLKDSACVDVCPVDCIYTRDQDDMYYISPDECIDCAACEPVCPVTAIFAEDAVPDQWSKYLRFQRPTLTRGYLRFGFPSRHVSGFNWSVIHVVSKESWTDKF